MSNRHELLDGATSPISRRDKLLLLQLLHANTAGANVCPFVAGHSSAASEGKNATELMPKVVSCSLASNGPVRAQQLQ